MVQQIIEFIKSWFKKQEPDGYTEFEWSFVWELTWWEVMAILVIIGLVLYWIWKQKEYHS